MEPLDPSQITEEQAAESKKHGKRLRVLVALLIVVLIAVVGGVAYFIMNDNVEEKTQQDDKALVNQADSQGESAVSSAPVAVAEIPNIVSLLGMSGDDAVASFGGQVKSYSDTDVAQEDSNVVTLRRIELKTTRDMADDGNSSTNNTGKTNPAVSLSLDESGTVIGTYYTVDLSLLGVGNKLFAETIVETDKLAEYLTAAGIEAGAGTLQAPSESDLNVELVTTSDGRTVASKESYTYEGDAAVVTPDELRHWTLGLEYDHALANTTGDATDVSRNLVIRITPPPYVAPEAEEEAAE